MAIIEEQPPLELTTGEEPRQPHVDPMGVFARPKATTGWRSWISTVDHKKIGIMYGVASFFFFLVAGVEALMIRLQLAVPGNHLLSADLYNQVFTMHGVTMVFMVIMPLAAAFANYLLPLQIGARDVSFPRHERPVAVAVADRVRSSSTPRGSSVAAPTAAGSTTRRTRASSSRPVTASTSTRSA